MSDYKTLYVILTANASSYDSVLTRAGMKTDRFGQQLDGASDSSSRLSTELNSMSGRVRLFLDALALVGPATVPIGAVAIPAVAGLAAELGFAATAVGAVMVASMGMKDGFKALNDYGLEPTAENAEKVRQAFAKLAPEAQQYIMQIDEALPRLEAAQKAIAGSFFEGAGRGTTDLLTVLPQVRRLMVETADVAGDLAAETGEALSTDKAQKFIRFLRLNVRESLTDTYHIVSDLAEGVADLWMAFDSSNDDFSKWLLGRADAFASFAEGLDDSQGFEDFLNYVNETGPQVQDTFVAIADAMLQIVEAAAPLGGPVLASLEVFADIIGTIADSPFGSRIVVAVAALTLLNRTLAITQALMMKAGFTGVAGGIAARRAAGPTGPFAPIVSGAQAGSLSVRGVTSDLRAMRGEFRNLGATRAVATSFFSQTTAAAQRTRGAASMVTKAMAGSALGVAAFAVASGSMGKDLGLQNTAMLGLVGSMMGPYGAAIGATVGALIDYKSVNKDVEAAIDSFDATVSNQIVTLEQYRAAVASLSAESDTFLQKNAGASESRLGFMMHSLTPSGIRTNLDVLFGGVESSELGKVAAAQDLAVEKSEDLEAALTSLARQGGMTQLDGITVSTAQMERALEGATPAMEALGISTEDLINSVRDGSFPVLSKQITDYQRNADSARGRTDAFADAVSDLQYDALSTADSAAALSAALQALLSPDLNAEQAFDKWRQSITTLRKDLKVKGGFDAGSEQGLANRNLTRQYVADSIERLSTLAAVSTTTEKQMADAVSRTRDEFIKSGIAAGFDRDQMVARAKALGLTPKLVKTVFEAAGITKADLLARQLRASYDALPDKVQTLIRTEGVPTTNAEIDRLVKKYHLTEKQRTALVTIKDLASAGIIDVQQLLNRVDRTRAQARLEAEAASARAAIQDIIDRLNNLDGKTATTYVQVRQQSFASKQAGILAGGQANGGEWRGGVLQYADGGFGGNGRYYPREPMMVRGGANILWGEPETGWEAYISGKPGREGRNIGILRAAAGRFGYGLTQRGAVTPGGQTVTVIQQQFPSKVKLVVGGREFNAHIAGIAGGVAKGAVGSAQERSTTAGRRDWP